MKTICENSVVWEAINALRLVPAGQARGQSSLFSARDPEKRAGLTPAPQPRST